MRLYILKLFSFSFMIVLLLSSCGSGGGGSAGAPLPIDTTPQKVLFAVYMTGSDLETNGQAASKDIVESLLSYEALTETQRKNTVIKFAFGGAKSTTWRGIKYADAPCLIEDYIENRVFGDGNCYTHEDRYANMGDEKTLTDFINSLSLKTSEYDKTILVFWNHGGAYTGVCYDENHKNDQLTLKEIEDSFKDTNANFDIIGMDACLMANLEVAKSISKYGKYLVASEELEPGHGWDYKALIDSIAENSYLPLESFTKFFVDLYMDSQDHINTHNKTLSVINLKKIDSFLESFKDTLDSLDSKGDYMNILLSARDAQQYAVNPKSTIPIGKTMDLKAFLQQLQQKKANLNYEIINLNAMIDNFVVYNRFQSSKPNSNGISIFQPLNTKSLEIYYKKNDEFISNEWFNLVGGVLSVGLNDTQNPVINSETICAGGHCIDATDNIGISEAESFNLLPYGDDFLLLGSDKLSQTSTNQYFLPNMDDSWLYFCDGYSDNCLIPSAIFIEKYDDKYLYASYANVNGVFSEFFIEVDTKYGTLKYWSVEVNDDGISSKRQKTITKGDTLEFYYYILNSNGEGRWIIGDRWTFQNEPETQIKKLDATIYYFADFSDFKGNSVTSDVYSSDD
jgi:hypothetical protein